MKKGDINKWSDISQKVSVNDLLKSYSKPCTFQIEFKQLIEPYFIEMNDPSCIEVGSSFGLTSALLDTKFSKTLLDIDDIALEKAKLVFRELGQDIKLLKLDMFELHKIDTKFDLVFNSGVLEHFNYKERCKIINNMSSITKNNGYVIVGIPNHNSLPYRIGYIYNRLIGNWIYPKEYKVNDIKKELSLVNSLKFISELNIDKENIYNYLPHLLKKIFKITDKLFSYEGYLKVLIFRKEVKNDEYTCCNF